VLAIAQILDARRELPLKIPTEMVLPVPQRVLKILESAN
jgi:hypothetical protein